MSDIRLQMTDEESEQFRELSEDKQQEFLEGTQLRRQHLMLKTAVTSMFLVECFDELAELGLQRYKLKQLGKKYNQHLEKFMNEIFDVNENDSDSTSYLNSKIKELHKLFEL